ACRSDRWRSASPGRSTRRCLLPPCSLWVIQPSPRALIAGARSRRKKSPRNRVKKPDGGLEPGATIGILGAGQLGRMLALAGARLGLKSHIYAPDAGEPAFDVAADGTVAAYENEAALARFAEAVDVITYEFENIPAPTAAFLS